MPRLSGSSSTYSLTSLASGTLTSVWPVRAKPNAASACRIGQVSWKPLTKVPCAYGVAALLGVAAHAEVAVGDGEQRLGDAEVVRVGAGSRPAATGRPGTGRGHGVRPRDRSRAVPSRDQLRQVAYDDVRAGLGQRLLARRRGRRRSTSAKSPAAAGPDAGHRVLEHDRRRGGRAEHLGGVGEGVRAPACRAARAPSATAPLTTVSNRSASPAASSTAGALADDETTASGVPRSRRWSSSGHRAGVGRRRRRARARR